MDKQIRIFMLIEDWEKISDEEFSIVSSDVRKFIPIVDWDSVNISSSVDAINTAEIGFSNLEQITSFNDSKFYSIILKKISVDSSLKFEINWAKDVLKRLIDQKRFKKFNLASDEDIEKHVLYEKAFQFGHMNLIYIDSWSPQFNCWWRSFTGYVSEISVAYNFNEQISGISLKCFGKKGLLSKFPIVIGRIEEAQESSFKEIYKSMKDLVSCTEFTNLLSNFGPSDSMTVIMNIMNYLYTAEGANVDELKEILANNSGNADSKSKLLNLLSRGTTGDLTKKYYRKRLFDRLSTSEAYPDYRVPEDASNLIDIYGTTNLVDIYYKPSSYSIDNFFTDPSNPRSDDPVFKKIFNNFNDLYTSAGIDYPADLLDRIAKSTMSYFYEDGQGNLLIEYPAYDHLPKKDGLDPRVADGFNLFNSQEFHSSNYILDDFSLVGSDMISDSESGLVTRVRVNQESEYASMSTGDTVNSLYQGIWVDSAEREYKYGIREKVAETLFYGGGLTYPREVMSKYALAVANFLNSQVKGTALKLDQRPDLLLNRTVYLPKTNMIGLIVGIKHQVKVNGPFSTTIQLKFLRHPGEKILNPWIDVDWRQISVEEKVSSAKVTTKCVYPYPKGGAMVKSGVGSYDTGESSLSCNTNLEVPREYIHDEIDKSELFCLAHEDFAKTENIDKGIGYYASKYNFDPASFLEALLAIESTFGRDWRGYLSTLSRSGPFTNATYKTFCKKDKDPGRFITFKNLKSGILRNSFYPDLRLFNWLRTNFDLIGTSLALNEKYLTESMYSLFDSLEASETASIPFDFSGYTSKEKYFYARYHTGHEWRYLYFNNRGYPNSKAYSSSSFFRALCNSSENYNNIDFWRNINVAWSSFQIMYFPELVEYGGCRENPALFTRENIDSKVFSAVKSLIFDKLRRIDLAYKGATTKSFCFYDGDNFVYKDELTFVEAFFVAYNSGFSGTYYNDCKGFKHQLINTNNYAVDHGADPNSLKYKYYYGSGWYAYNQILTRNNQNKEEIA